MASLLSDSTKPVYRIIRIIVIFRIIKSQCFNLLVILATFIKFRKKNIRHLTLLYILVLLTYNFLIILYIGSLKLRILKLCLVFHV